jgi:hypothetical protein
VRDFSVYLQLPREDVIVVFIFVYTKHYFSPYMLPCKKHTGAFGIMAFISSLQQLVERCICKNEKRKESVAAVTEQTCQNYFYAHLILLSITYSTN